MTSAGLQQHHDHDHDDVSAGGGRHGAVLVAAGLALALVALVAGLLLGQRMGQAGAMRVEDEVSVGFLRDMGVHHAQAVQMSEIAHRRAADRGLTHLAFDILSTQQGQIGIMQGWLDLSRQAPSRPGPPMAWMGHRGPMPGMATAGEIRRLDALPVPAMEEQFLRLMVRHHRGAVPMADAAAARAGSPDVAVLARSMSEGQQSEIDAMQGLLRQRGLAPEPDGTSGSGATGSGADPPTPVHPAPGASTHGSH